MERPNFFVSFTRSQLSSFAATAVDFATLVFLVEVAGAWYVPATVLGAITGAITNFMLGRHWSFVASDGQISFQVMKYAMVSGMSLILNTIGVYVITDYIGLKYTMSKVVTAAFVGIFFNFPLHRKFVFKVASSEKVSSVV